MQRRILLSEGSSLSSRETITALGLAGHRIELVSSDPLCIGRFSRFVRRVHYAPRSGIDPDGYLSAVIEVVKKHNIDALIPVHEQAYLFAAARRQFPATLGLALANFDAFEQVQSKVKFSALLSRLNVPQPATEMVRSASDLMVDRGYPFFIKTAFGTASTGVWRIADAEQRNSALTRLEERGAFGKGLLIQTATVGQLERTQAVFDRGSVVACHIYRQVAKGPGGGDILKSSVNRPEVHKLVERIGRSLAWHGALSFDYIFEEATGTPLFIDANPRLVEPMSALLSGVDIAGALLRVSIGDAAPPQSASREGVLTRVGLMGILDAAQRRGSRRDILNEIVLLIRNSGRYSRAREELTPMGTDPWCAIPLIFVAAKLLFSPGAAARFLQDTVSAYSLTPDAILRIRAWGSDSESDDLKV